MKEFLISPSKVLNYYYPMPPIDELVLKKAGTRGSIIHKQIELQMKEKEVDIYNLNIGIDPNNKFEYIDYSILEQKDWEKIEQLSSNAKLITNEVYKPIKTETWLKTDKLRGIVDFIGIKDKEDVIVDWKTNSQFGDSEKEKYGLQMNIYRYMYFKNFGKEINKMILVLITKNKTKNKIKEFEVPIMSFEEVEQKVNEAYDFYATQEKINKGEIMQNIENTPLDFTGNAQVVEEIPASNPFEVQKPTINEQQVTAEVFTTENSNAPFKVVKTVNKHKLFLVLGEPGSGKTTLASQISDYYGKGLFFEIGKDNGYSVLSQNIDVVSGQVINDYEKEQNAYVKLKNYLEYILNNINQFTQYQTIIFDPINNLQDEIQRFIEKQVGKSLNQNQWGTISKNFNDIVDLIFRLQENFNIVILSHVKTMSSTDDLRGETSTQIIPLLTENNGKKFTKVADACIYTTPIKNATGQDFGMYIGVHPLLPTKIRISKDKNKVIPTTVIPADFKKIADYYWNEK